MLKIKNKEHFYEVLDKCARKYNSDSYKIREYRNGHLPRHYLAKFLYDYMDFNYGGRYLSSPSGELLSKGILNYALVQGKWYFLEAFRNGYCIVKVEDFDRFKEDLPYLSRNEVESLVFYLQINVPTNTFDYIKSIYGSMYVSSCYNNDIEEFDNAVNIINEYKYFAV